MVRELPYHKEVRERKRGNLRHSPNFVAAAYRGNRVVEADLRPENPVTNQMLNLISAVIAFPQRYSALLFQVLEDLRTGQRNSVLSRKLTSYYGGRTADARRHNVGWVDRLMTNLRQFVVYWLTGPLVLRNREHLALVELPEQRYTPEVVHNFFERNAERLGITLPHQYPVSQTIWDYLHTFYRTYFARDYVRRLYRTYFATPRLTWNGRQELWPNRPSRVD